MTQVGQLIIHENGKTYKFRYECFRLDKELY